MKLLIGQGDPSVSACEQAAESTENTGAFAGESDFPREQTLRTSFSVTLQRCGSNSHAIYRN